MNFRPSFAAVITSYSIHYTKLYESPFIAEVMVYGHKVSSGAEEVHASIFPDQEAVDNYGREKGLVPMSTEQVEKLIRDEVLDVV